VAVAAASIAQVHRARLCSGEEVVVKVQRPGLRARVLDDIAVLAWLAPQLKRRVPISAVANPPGIVQLFAGTILEELDFRIEAENMLDMAAMLSRCGITTVITPRPHPELVTRRVMVMERLEGIAFDDVDAMRDAGIDTHELLSAGMLGFLEGVMVEGIFHGDLHAGNVLVTADGRYALVDFGITGRLDEEARRSFIRLIFCAARGDVKGQFRALADLGAFPPEIDLDAFIHEVGADQQPVDVLQVAPEELQKAFQDVTRTLQAYGVTFPKDLMLFIKNFLYLDGAIARLAPDLNILREAERILLALASKYGDLITELVGIPGDLIVGGLSALGGAGIPEEQMELTWNLAQQRREEMARRMGELRRKRRGQKTT
jgi:ubiquinone biosynthesis protein